MYDDKARKNPFDFWKGYWVVFKYKSAGTHYLGRVIDSRSNGWAKFEFQGGGVGWRCIKGHEIKAVYLPTVEAPARDS